MAGTDQSHERTFLSRVGTLYPVSSTLNSSGDISHDAARVTRAVSRAAPLCIALRRDSRRRARSRVRLRPKSAPLLGSSGSSPAHRRFDGIGIGIVARRVGDRHSFVLYHLSSVRVRRLSGNGLLTLPRRISYVGRRPA